MRKISLLALACALAPTGLCAQTYQRVISFGDSLTDNGNLFSITGQPPAPYNQRFTNGITFAEVLAGGVAKPMQGFVDASTNGVGTGSVNFAFGGARNDDLPNSNDVPGSGFTIPSTITQIGAYSALGGTYGARDVATYFAGANNLFQSTTAAAANPATSQAMVQADATAAGIGVGQQVGGIAAAGARTIVVMNLPDFGSLPAYTSLGPQGIALGSFASTVFNSASGQAVQAAAAAVPGTNFIQVDTSAVFATVIANPGAFGFSNVTQPCFNQAAATLCAPTKAAQNQFLFWDTVHPTDAGHALLANVIGDYLYAPTRTAGVAMLGDVGLQSRRSSSLDMLDKARSFVPKGAGAEFFVSIAGDHGQRSGSVVAQQGIGGLLVTSTGRAYDYSQVGLRIGGFKALSNDWSAGFAVSALTGDAKAGTISASPTSLSIDLSARWRRGPAFVTGQIGGGVDRFSDYQRKTSLAAVTQGGSTDGISFSTTLEGGYDVGFGNFTLTPVGRISYLHTNVFGFNENGPFAAVAFGSRTVQGLTGAVELRGKVAISDTASLHALVGYENFLASSSQAVRGKLINNTAQGFATSVAKPVGAGLIFGAGIEAGFGRWTTAVNYRGAVGEKSQMSHKGELRVGYAW